MTSASPAGAGSCSPEDKLLAEVAAFITAEFGKVITEEDEQAASLAAVAASGRFSKRTKLP